MISVQLPGFGDLKGSPFSVAVGHADAVAANSHATIDHEVGHAAWPVSATGRVTVTTADAFGNVVLSGGAAVAIVSTTGRFVLHADVTDVGDGSYLGVVSNLVLGTAAVVSTLDGEILGSGGTLSVEVVAGPADPKH